MPELPEVETVKRGLEPVLVGRRFARVEARVPALRFPLPDRFSEQLEGQRVLSLERRAKYLVAEISCRHSLIMHLGMTGRFTICEDRGGEEALGRYIYNTAADQKHDHVVFHFRGAGRIVYNDPRRFGFMLLVPKEERVTHPLFAKLGPEPLDDTFDAAHLARRAAGRKIDLKAFLLDQSTVAGLGNIYVSEALSRAGLSPRRAASTLSRRNASPAAMTETLVQSIKSVLGDAIRAGGSTLRDYRHADGASGAFQETFRVYDREGAACVNSGCSGFVRRIVQSGRATFYCPKCQR